MGLNRFFVVHVLARNDPKKKSKILAFAVTDTETTSITRGVCDWFVVGNGFRSEEG